MTGGVLLVRTSGPVLARTVESILLAQGAAFDLSGDIALNTAHRNVTDGSNPHNTAHNNTTGKQGGAVDEFYHLTENQNGAAVNSPTTPTATNPYITVGDSIDRDAIIFAMRVVANGGIVEDIDFLDSFFKDAKYNIIYPYFNDIVAAHSPSWGRKGATSLNKLYSVIGAAQDMTQAVGSKQLLVTPGAENGRTIMTADGISQIIRASFPFSGPETIVLMGYRLLTWSNTKLLIDGAGIADGALQMIGASPSFNCNVNGAGALSANTDLAINTVGHVRAKFNDPIDCAIQVNGNAETTDVLVTGPEDMLGFTFGGAGNDTLFTNESVGITLCLDAPIDANYLAKMAAIRAFGQGAYNTP